MNSNSTRNGKKIAGLILTAVLVVGSLGTAAALAANSADAVPKDTVMSAPAPVTPSETAAVTQGTIQYSKDVYAMADGSQNDTFERWYDPATKTYRSDIKEYSADHQLISWKSNYYLHGATELIIILRDQNGNPVSGTDMKDGEILNIMQLKLEYADFDHVKQQYTSDIWTNIGTEQAADGKTLIKLTSSWQKWTGDGDVTTESEYNVQEIMYIDQETGLPVKSDLYEDSTGQNKLFSSDINEYKYVTDDGTLFKVPNIALTPITEQSSAPAAVPADTSSN